MKEFTIEELGLFITIILGGCGGLFAVIFKSRCKTIKTPCLSCEREVLSEKYLKNTKSAESLPALPTHNASGVLTPVSPSPAPESSP